MNELQEQLQQIELTLEDAKALVDRRERLKRLEQNADFQALIKDEYLEKEAIRLVHSYGHPAFARNQAEIQKDMIGIGSFISFLNTVHQTGEMAADTIAQHEEMRAELEEEDEA